MCVVAADVHAVRCTDDPWPHAATWQDCEDYQHPQPGSSTSSSKAPAAAGSPAGMQLFQAPPPASGPDMPSTWRALHCGQPSPSHLEACQWLRDAAGSERLLLPVERPWEGVVLDSAAGGSDAPAGLHLAPVPGPEETAVQLSADTQVGSRALGIGRTLAWYWPWPDTAGLMLPVTACLLALAAPPAGDDGDRGMCQAAECTRCTQASAG